MDASSGKLGGSLQRIGETAAGFLTASSIQSGVQSLVSGLKSVTSAAIEDEASQKRLAEVLKTTTDASATQIAQVEKWIDVTQRATGVADDDLRPALAELTRQTKDTAEAEKLLGLAMDVAQGTGKPLADVTDALSKAYNGNEKAIKALSPELTGLIKDGASANDVMSALAETFGGQAAANAETAQGKMARLNVAFEEMKESLGAKLLPILTQFGGWLLDTGIPKLEEIGRNVEVWWGKQEELKTSIKEGLENLKDFTQNGLIPFGEEAWKAYQKVQPLVDAMNRIEHITSGVGAFGTGGGSIIEQAQNVGAGAAGGAAAGRAGGGPVMRGTAYMVGERGPELFVPGASGSIVPNSGGVTVIVQGSVLSERDLVAVLNNATRRGLVVGG